MIHLTLKTGDSRESPRREVNNTVITSLTPLVGVLSTTNRKPPLSSHDLYFS